MGSLVAALGSYLNARHQGGNWLVRMDDIDTPRNVPGIDKIILQTLDHHALHWDGPVYYSSDHLADYEAAFQTLKTAGALFPCGCSRREISNHPVNSARQSGQTLVYPGTCRDGKAEESPLRSYRLRVTSSPIRFNDRLQGQQSDCLINSVGDFVVKDRNDQHHYQLATVVDDHRQQITEVVRGADLLSSTARQIHLQTQLGYNRPEYLHLPVVNNELGFKLSKQQGATAIDDSRASRNLVAALTLLAQQPPMELISLTPAEIVQWGIKHWETEPLTRMPTTLAN
jgi:glutamyl-Q tRNA(Asp) synthetase